MNLTLVQVAEPDQSGMGVWQVRDGAQVYGHIVASAEAFEAIRDGLKLLAGATAAVSQNDNVVSLNNRSASRGRSW